MVLALIRFCLDNVKCVPMYIRDVSVFGLVLCMVLFVACFVYVIVCLPVYVYNIVCLRLCGRGKGIFIQIVRDTTLLRSARSLEKIVALLVIFLL